MMNNFPLLADIRFPSYVLTLLVVIGALWVFTHRVPVLFWILIGIGLVAGAFPGDMLAQGVSGLIGAALGPLLLLGLLWWGIKIILGVKPSRERNCCRRDRYRNCCHEHFTQS